MNTKKYIVLFAALFSIIIAAFFLKVRFRGKKENLVVIRTYEKNDQKAVLNMLYDNWFWLIEGECRKEDYDFKKQLDEKRTDSCNGEELNIKVITVDGMVAGYSTYHRYFDDKIIKIQFLCIEKKYRRMHLAEKLVKNVIEEIFSKDEVEMIILTTRSENIRAQNLYKKLGFEEIQKEEDGGGTILLALKKDVKKNSL
jgi:ribosomal protein S18 acetylase RimI-like enzyme